MTSLERFLIDIWRLAAITGASRPDAFVMLWYRNDHLISCAESYLVPGEVGELSGKLLLAATVMCGHGEATDVEYSLNKDLWILEKANEDGEAPV